MKTLSYFNLKHSPRVPLVSFTVEKIRRENFYFVLSFFFSIIHNSKSIWRIQTILTLNERSTIEDLPFVDESWMRAKIIKLWPQTHIAVAFIYGILCVNTRTTWKLKVAQGCCTYGTIALLSEISILLVRAVCEIWSVSYGSKYASRPLSDTTFCV